MLSLNIAAKYVESDKNVFFWGGALTSGSRVEDGELELLVGPDDEDGPAGEREPGGVLLVRVDHAVGDGDLAGGVGHDGEGHPAELLPLLDVLDPSHVALNAVARQGDQLHLIRGRKKMNIKSGNTFSPKKTMQKRPSLI